MSSSKTPKRSNSRYENPATHSPTTPTKRSKTLDFNEKHQSGSSSKSEHRIHLPHLPHPHLHRHDVKSPSISTPSTSSPPTIHHKPNNKTKPPSAHANLSPTQPQSSISITSNSNSILPNRPTNLRRQTSVKTRYMAMLLDLDTIPRLHNILASFFNWILLAGYIVFPGTFTSLQSKTENTEVASNKTAQTVLKHVKNAPLLWIAGFCCGIGAVGMIWLWWRWRQNFVWLINRIFLPGTLNSLAGLISTLVNVYSQQNRTWSISAKVTAAVSGACMVILAILFALYNFWVLRRVKRQHAKEMRLAGVEGNGNGNGERKEEEGILGMVHRKVMEPPLEPGSVV